MIHYVRTLQVGRRTKRTEMYQNRSKRRRSAPAVKSHSWLSTLDANREQGNRAQLLSPLQRPVKVGPENLVDSHRGGVAL